MQYLLVKQSNIYVCLLLKRVEEIIQTQLKRYNVGSRLCNIYHGNFYQSNSKKFEFKLKTLATYNV